MSLIRRNPIPILGVWIAVIAVCAATYWLQHRAPAFEDLLQPVYWISGVLLVLVTFKWVRGRKEKERREIERRQQARREDATSPNE